MVAAMGYGVSDFVGGVASRRVAALRVVIISYPVSLVIVLIAAAVVGGRPSTTPMLWGFAAGLAGGFAVWWFYLALAAGPMAIVSPVTAVLVAGIPVLTGLAIGERPSGFAYAGIALALVAVVMVSKESPDAVAGEVAGGRELRFTPRVAWLTVGSGATFAFAFVALHEIGSGAGLWPLAASRFSATAVVWIVALGVGQFSAPRASVVRLAVGISVLDVLSNTSMLYAFQGGLLSLVSVIGSLYPAATVMLAMVMLGERVGKLQAMGMVVALAAVSIIAISSA